LERILPEKDKKFKIQKTDWLSASLPTKKSLPITDKLSKKIKT
jgi:hypothetical protein